MSPQLEALLCGCKEAPEDNEPRLVLADWLEEHGEADRAEFVRLQLRLAPDDPVAAPRPFACPDPDEAEVEGRAWELWRQHRTEWLGPLAETGLDVRFRRGLVSVRVQRGQVERLAGVCERPTPWLETLCLDPATSPALREVLANDWLAPFTRLELLRGLSDPGMPAELIAAGKAVAHLRALVVAYGGPGDWLALVDRPDFAGLRLVRVGLMGEPEAVSPVAVPSALRALAVVPGRLEDERMVELFAGVRYPGITRLALQGRISAEALRTLASSPLLGRLEWLNLTRSSLDRQGAEALAALPAPLRLRGLNLAECPDLRSQSVARLLVAPLMGSVTHLDVGGTVCGLRVAQAVARSSWLGRLEVLTLGYGKAGDAGAAALARATGLRSLRRLAIRACDIGAAGAAALASAPWAGTLETLELGFNPLTAAGWKALAPLAGSSLRRLGLTRTCQVPSTAIPRLALPAGLMTLDLSANALGPAGLAALLPALEPLEQLSDLRIDDNALGDEGARLLAASPVARRLRLLHLGNNGLTADGLGPLLDALGPGRLTDLRLFGNKLGLAGLRLLEDWPARERLATLLVQGNNVQDTETELYRFWGNEM
jgi:uncharacterized protein (TIGR02996 family)